MCSTDHQSVTLSLNSFQSIMLHILICTGGPPPKSYFEPGKTLLTGHWKLRQTPADVSAVPWSATQADKSRHIMALNYKKEQRTGFK